VDTVKLASGDPNWWNLSALSYHFLTQPLPTSLAWYAAQLPPSVLKFATGGMFFVELVLPFLIFLRRRLRRCRVLPTFSLEFKIQDETSTRPCDRSGHVQHHGNAAVFKSHRSDVDVGWGFTHGAVDDFVGGGEADCFTRAVHREVSRSPHVLIRIQNSR